MERKEIEKLINRIVEESTLNVAPIPNGKALYEKPLIGIGSATDPLFSRFKEENVIGPWYNTPTEWLTFGKTVISFFFPASEEVKAANRHSKESTGEYWLYARVEGQEYIKDTMLKLKNALKDEFGINAVVPQYDERFHAVIGGKGLADYTNLSEDVYGSNWSERHAGFVCGLGTFGLSKGLITEKGIAGRMGSIIIDEFIEPDKRAYTEIYEYCNKCGACVKKCPANAISIEKGKDHKICRPWVDKTKEKYAPRYGCGLCQCGTPCESGIPKPR